MKKTSFKAGNFNKLTPTFWKRIGNTAIYSLPLLTTAVMASPLDGDTRTWINFGLTILLVAAKGITKFFKEENENI